MTFPYGDGVGSIANPSAASTDSVGAIEGFAAGSGINLTVTNSIDYGAASYHGTGNAVDFSNGGDAGTPQMDAFAAWWEGYAAYLLELIHVNQDGSMVGVKNGQIVDALQFYGAATMQQHHNHVHVAATLHGIQAAGAGGVTPPASGADPGATNGGATVDANSTFAIFSASFWKQVGLGAAGVLIVVLGADITKRGLHVKATG